MRDVILRAAARVLGQRGGGVRSDRQKQSFLKNANKRGRKCKYTYEMKAEACFGKKYKRICAIPDAVAEDPGQFLNKTFGVRMEGKRFNARVWSFSEDKKSISVKRV